LDKHFTKDEIFAAFCSMQNGKSIGVDGLSYEFYKDVWDIIGNDVKHLASETFFLRCFMKSISQELIKTIFKNVARGTKPITLLSVACKITTKAMVLWVSDVAKNICIRSSHFSRGNLS
jgi:hypothetical protein